MDKHYYIELDDQMYGPFNLEKVREFGLYANTPVCVPANGEEWKSAIEYPELTDCIVANNTVVLQETINTQSDIFNTNFYYRRDEELYGPFSVYELGALDIQNDTLLGINNTADWQYASDINNLLDALQLLREMQEEETQKLKERLEIETKYDDEIRLSNQELKNENRERMNWDRFNNPNFSELNALEFKKIINNSINH